MDEKKRRSVLEDGLLQMARRLERQGFSHFGENSWQVPTDIYETGEAFVVYMELAGVDPASIQVVAEEKMLTISGSREYPLPAQVQRVHRLEIERGRFEQRLKLPLYINVTTAETEHRHGLLKITLPKQKRVVRVPVIPG